MSDRDLATTIRTLLLLPKYVTLQEFQSVRLVIFHHLQSMFFSAFRHSRAKYGQMNHTLERVTKPRGAYPHKENM